MKMVAATSLIRSQTSEAAECEIAVQSMGADTDTLTEITFTAFQQEQTFILFLYASAQK
jgi:hypothetical protein